MSTATPATPPLDRADARRINVHHHFLPPAYMKAVEDHLPPGRGRQRAADWTPERDIAEMDAAGIELALGSISIPGVWFGDIGLARRLMRLWNEFAANVVRDHPRRFGFFATIAPPDVEGALREVEYALDVLRADGVALMSSYDGRWLGDDAFRPLMRELDRRNATAFVHPAGVGEDQTPPGVKAHVLEGPFDTTRTIASLLKNGTFASCPGIRFIFAHGGGAMPFLAGRLAALTDGSAAMAPENIRRQLSRLYFDTALSINEPALAALTKFSPPSQILLGTDSPIIPARAEIAAWLAIDLDPGLRRLVERDNAVALLRRDRPG